MSEVTAYCEQALSAALEKGAACAETYAVRSEQLSIGVLDAQMDTCQSSVDAGVCLRVTQNNRVGYAYTQALDGPQKLAAQASENAGVLENDDEQPYYAGGAYPAIRREEAALTSEQALQYALELERIALGLDKRVKRVQACRTFCATSRVHLLNTLGLDASRRHSEAGAYVMPVVEQSGEERNGFAFRLGASWQDDLEALAREAANDALEQLGARPISSGAYPVVLRNDAAASLLTAFAGMFSAENAQKGLSLLRGRVGEPIASPLLTLVDDPTYTGGYAPTPFDDEGVAASRTVLLEGGVLHTLLHNLKTALKDGTLTTGNAGKPSNASPVGVTPSQFFFAPGQTSLDALCQRMGTGLLITDFSGLHAGANAVSGDFSLMCRGFWISNGVREHPIAQVTAAGNFLELLQNVQVVGNDLRFDLPGARGCFGSPSLWLESLRIAGK